MRLRKRRRGAKRRRTPQERTDIVPVEIDELFGPSRKHIHERKEWVAVAKVDDHESGGTGPVDLDSGKIQLRLPDPAN